MTKTALHTPMSLESMRRAVALTDNAELIAAASAYCTVRLFEKGDTVLQKGSRDSSFYYVHSGGVEVSSCCDDRKNVIALIRPGQFFGEVGFFDNTGRNRNINALEETELYIFDKAGLAEMQQRDPVLHGRFLTMVTRSICLKFRRVLDERRVLATYSASMRPNKKSYDSCRLPLHDDFLWSSQWKTVQKIVEEFKADFFDISHALQDIPGEDIPAKLQQEFNLVIDKFAYRLLDLEPFILNSHYEEAIRGYIFKEIFPYIMRSRFGERAYFKPKGYAGDFRMIEHLYANVAAGDGKIGKLVDAWLLNTAAAVAIRGRRKLLAEQLHLLTVPLAEAGESIRIMNLACGSNRELFDFLEKCPYTEKIKATCIDLDIEALEFTNREVNTFPHNASIRLLRDNLIKWALGKNRYDHAPQDIIYSSGLMDYFERKLFIRLVNRCYDQLKPGGVLMIGNFSPANPNRPLMDHILSWQLIHRDEKNLRDIFARTRFGHHVSIIAEKLGINLFAVARKI